MEKNAGWNVSFFLVIIIACYVNTGLLLMWQPLFLGFVILKKDYYLSQIKRSSLLTTFWGTEQIRTAVGGFADLSLAPRPRYPVFCRHLLKFLSRPQPIRRRRTRYRYLWHLLKFVSLPQPIRLRRTRYRYLWYLLKFVCLPQPIRLRRTRYRLNFRFKILDLNLKRANISRFFRRL